MKIVCDSCGAKYSIADEKVAGRVFKIRCKKCGAAIVVKGDAGQAEAGGGGAAGGNFDYGGEAVWHTVVDGEQQGPFSPTQLGSMISAGTIGWDAYVWREGFDDWKPAQDIEELVQQIMNPGGAPAAGAEDPFSDQPTMMAGGSSPAPAAAKAAKRDAGADLFAQSEASPFGGGGGGDDDDVVASAPSPRVGGGGGGGAAMTGARNENSVLFSLSNLQALATGGSGGGGGASPAPSKASGPAPKAGMAAGEGSGLIDIRALASATGLTGGAASPGPSLGSPIASPAKVDDLLSIGSPSVGLGSALAAPVVIAEKPEPARGGGSGMVIAAAIVAVAVLGGAGIFAYVSLNQPDPAATVPAAAAIAPTTPPPTTTVAAAPPPTTTVATAPVATTAAPPASTAEAPATGGSSGSTGGGGHRRTGGTGSSTTASTTASAPDPTPASSGSSGSRGSTSASSGGGDRSIDALLEGALGPSSGRRTGSTGSSSTASTPAPSGGGGDASLPATPGRSDVVSAMSGVQGAVTACGGGEHGVATVSVSVSGSTGHVSNASVTGQFAGTPVGSCIARAVRGASFPHFRNPTFTFSYPFRI